MIRTLAVMFAWGALIALVTWSGYDWFVCVLLFPPTAIGVVVGAAAATHLLTYRAGTLARRLLRSLAYVLAVAGMASTIAYFIWWGIAYDAAESMTELSGPDLEPWLYGGSVTCIALSVYVAGVAWLWWWSGRRDSNSQHSVWKAETLTN